MGLFKRSSHQHEDVTVVRIDLSSRQYSWLIRTIERDDARSIKDCVKARLTKDEKGYFLRLPLPEYELLDSALYSFWEKESNEFIQNLPDTLDTMRQLSPADKLNKILAMKEEQGDLLELIQVFQYQCCPEEYHPFGPR